MKETYNLPPQIQVALTTNGHEFVNIWVKENPEEREEIGRLLSDLIKDRLVLYEQLQDLKQHAANVTGTCESFVRRVDSAMISALGARQEKE